MLKKDFLEDLSFDMTPKQVKFWFGKPDDIEAEIENVYWLYSPDEPFDRRYPNGEDAKKIMDLWDYL